jgi:hypothetical protein
MNLFKVCEAHKTGWTVYIREELAIVIDKEWIPISGWAKEASSFDHPEEVVGLQ